MWEQLAKLFVCSTLQGISFDVKHLKFRNVIVAQLLFENRSKKELSRISYHAFVGRDPMDVIATGRVNRVSRYSRRGQ